MKDPLEEASEDVDRRGATFLLIAIVLGLVALAAFRPQSRDAVLIVVGIVIMVMLHEAGHFIAARRTGMKATEFFLGFGPRLWSFRRGETEYGVKAVPAGGYVRIIGMTNLEDVEADDEPRTYRRAQYKDRLIVVLAGVTVNALLAFVLLFAAYAGQGLPDGPSTTIDYTVPKSAAAAAGLKPGDRIVRVDGERISSWKQLTKAIESRGGEATSFTIIRDDKRMNVEATPKMRDGQGFLGISPDTRYRSIGGFSAAGESLETMGDVTVGTAKAIGSLFTPGGIERYTKNFGSDAPKEGTRAAAERPRSLVGIVDEGSRLIDGDPWALLRLLALISLVLALFNTIPLLPFDGGHAAVAVYEMVASKVKRRRVTVDYRKLMPVTAIVLAFFLTLGLSAMFLDIRNLGS